MPITYRPLSEVPLETILTTFNKAFEDYPVPVSMTAERFSFKRQSEDIDLSISPGAFEEGKMVGVILNAYRNLEGRMTGYNAGTGVVASHRGRHLVAGMYEFAAPLMREKGVAREILEVFEQNTVAFRAYENRGYQVVRKLNCFRGVPRIASLPPSYSLSEILPDQLFEFESAWDCRPAWQFMRPSIMNFVHRNRFLGLFKDRELVGTMAFDPVRSYLLHLYIVPAHRGKGLAATALSHIHEATGAPVSAINVDTRAGADLCAMFEIMGMPSFVCQFEMARESR